MACPFPIGHEQYTRNRALRLFRFCPLHDRCPLKRACLTACIIRKLFLNRILKEFLTDQYIQEGHQLINRGDHTSAFEACTKALHWSPHSIVAHHLKGFVLSELKRYHDAICSYEEAIRLGLNAASVYKERGDAFYHLGCYNDALQSYQKAFAIKPDFVAAYRGAALTLHEIAKENEHLAQEYDNKVRMLIESVGESIQEDF